jgi:very-short-patch-repair endonuclease
LRRFSSNSLYTIFVCKGYSNRTVSAVSFNSHRTNISTALLEKYKFIENEWWLAVGREALEMVKVEAIIILAHYIVVFFKRKVIVFLIRVF